MQEIGITVDEASRRAAQVGLKNGVYNVMTYDNAVCRRGILTKHDFAALLDKHIENIVDVKDKETLKHIKQTLLCLYPRSHINMRGEIQIDYTAGFHISKESIPNEAKQWTESKEEWPSQSLKTAVLTEGAMLVPKTFQDNTKAEKAKRWRMNFDLNKIIDDPNYSMNVDRRRVLIILKDIKKHILQFLIVKSYFLKLCIAWAMFENQGQRRTMKTKDLLVMSLKFLSKSLKSMKLPDFFNPKFNHLHRKRDRRYEAGQVAEKIDKYLDTDSLEKIILELEGAQQSYKQNIAKSILDNKVELWSNFKSVSREMCVVTISKYLPQLDEDLIGRVHDWIGGFVGDSITYGEMIESARKKAKMEKRRRAWQPILKERYRSLVQNGRIGNVNQVEGESLLPSNQDRLSKSIFQNYRSNVEPQEIKQLKFKIWDEMEKILNKKYKCHVFGFGSTFNGFGLNGCDLDLQVFSIDEDGITNISILNRIAAELINNAFIRKDAKIIKNARVPIIKGIHQSSGIALDISIAMGFSSSNVRDAHLLYYCSRQDPRVAPLMFAIKKWAQCHNINDASKHTLSSHAIALMLVHYLTVKSKLNLHINQ